VNRRRFVFSAGAAVVLPGSLATAARADVSEGELAYANFAIAAEYLMADFYAKALEAKLFHGSVREGATRAHFNEGEHARALSTLLTDAGQPVPLQDDFEFPWPKKTFETLGEAAKVGARIEGAVLGAYLSAAIALTRETYRSLFTRAAADEAQHLTVLSWVANGKPVGNSFPLPLDLEEATNVLGPYLG
jgi:hypothetical protein